MRATQKKTKSALKFMEPLELSSEFHCAAAGQQEVLTQCKVNRCYFFCRLFTGLNA